MKVLFFLIALGMISITPAFAEQVIFADFKQHVIAEVLEERSFIGSHITKIQGLTTTGDVFFIFTSSKTNFEYSMILDREGKWHKGELRDTTEQDNTSSSQESTIKESIQVHYLLDQYERVYNTTPYKFFVKTYDAAKYSGVDFQQFQGKISGATVKTIITDPNGVTKAELEGIVTDGTYEGSVVVPQNLWMRGWYTTDIVIEYESQSYADKLSFYVFGAPPPKGSDPPKDP
jgi:hypothetical protein